MKPEHTPLVLALMAGLLWGVFLTWIGIHTTADSVAYIHSALSVAESGALSANPIWPPLYPALLGLLTLVTGLPTVAAAVLSAITMTVLLAAVGRIVQWATGSTVISAVSMLFLCGWWEVLFIFRVAWSEQLFAALVALHLLMIIRHLESDRLSDLGLAALSVSLVALSRYIGYAMVGIFLLYAAAWVVRRREWRGIGVVGLGLSPVAGWLVRNLALSGTLHGNRSPTERTVLDNLSLLIEVLSGQLWQAPVLTALIVASVVAGGAVLWRGSGEVRRMLLYTGAWLVAYLLMLIYATSTVKMDHINPRFLSPILPTVLALCALAFGGLAALRPSSRSLLNGVFGAALLVGTISGGSVWVAGMSGLVSDVNTRSFHEQAGFSASQTAADLNVIIADRLRDRKRLDILLLTSESSGHKARLLLMRRGLLSGSGLSGATVQTTGKRTMTIGVQLDGEARELVATSPLNFRKRTGIRRAFRAAREDSVGELMVLARRKALLSAGVEDLTDVEPGCRLDVKVDPYLVYRCQSASVRR
ncbi:MAG: hypothetical protein ACI8RZ_004711 [Myxococcota bacterium]|jgi:hypothetical protein